MRILGYIVLIVLLLLGVTFAYLNANQVVFNYYFGEWSLPLSLLLLFTLGIGIILGWLAIFFPWLKLKRKSSRLKKELKYARQEIENLRSIPIKDSH